jgi:cbb3-type cytochrome oxidase subunit 3
MNRFVRRVLATGTSLLLLGWCLTPVFAQGLSANDTGLNDAANKAGYNTGLTCAGKPGGCIATFAGAAINALVAVFGALFLGLILYGGFQYLFSRGDKDAVKKARETIVNAIIGLLIVSISYAIADFVLTAMTSITSTATTTETTTQPTP